LASRMTDTSALVQFVVGDDQTTVIVATRKASKDLGELQTNTQGSAQPTAPTLALDPIWNRTVASVLDVRAYPIEMSRAQLALQVAHFTESIMGRLETIDADGRALYDRLLGPARDQLAGRTQLVVVPDDWLWTLPFQALRTPGDRYLDQDFT